MRPKTHFDSVHALSRELGQALSGLFLGTRRRRALVLSLALAGQLAAVWAFSITWEHARDRLAFEHSQALHTTATKLLSVLKDADLDPYAYQTLHLATPPLLATLRTLVADRREESRWLPSLTTDLDQLSSELSRLQFSAGPEVRSMNIEKERLAASQLVVKLSAELEQIDTAGQLALTRAMAGTDDVGWVAPVILGETVITLIAALLFASGPQKIAAGSHPEITQSPDALAASASEPPLDSAYQTLKAEVMGLVPSRTLADPEAMFRSVAQQASVAMYLRHAAGQYLFSNAPFNALISQAEPKGDKTPQDISTTGLAQALWPLDVEAFRPDAPLEMKIVPLNGKGNNAFRTLRFPLRYTDGTPYAVCGIVIDVQHHKNSTQMRSRDVPVLQSVLDSMNDGVVVLKADTSCLFANREIEAMLGKPISGTPLRSWAVEFGFSCDGSTPCATDDLPMVKALGGTVHHADIYINGRSTTPGRWLSVQATPIKERSRRCSGGCWRLQRYYGAPQS